MKEYNKTILNLFGTRRVPGEVGIEIEMEGNNILHSNIDPYWVFHEDHSLRGPENAEYVLRNPVPREEVPHALSDLFKKLKKYGAKIRNDSPNTSVHVHLNMQELSLKKVYTVACVWYILESSLMDWCGNDRAGNLFCLRASDAEASLQRLASAVRYGRYNELQDQDGLRYSAVNYTALGKFGSLEFRGLGGIYDEDVINQWVKILLSIKDFSIRYDNPTEVITEFSARGPEEFLRLVLPDGLHRLIETKDTGKQLRDGMRLIQNVAYCVNWEKDGEKKSKSGVGPVDEAFVILDGPGIPVEPRDMLGRDRNGNRVRNPILWQDFNLAQNNPVPDNPPRQAPVDEPEIAGAPPFNHGDVVPTHNVRVENWVADADGTHRGHDNWNRRIFYPANNPNMHWFYE